MSKGRINKSKRRHRAAVRKSFLRQYTVDELRAMLGERAWLFFFESNKGARHINHVLFECRLGLHMNRPVLAVRARGQLLVIKAITPNKIGTIFGGGVFQTQPQPVTTFGIFSPYYLACCGNLFDRIITDEQSAYAA